MGPQTWARIKFRSVLLRGQAREVACVDERVHLYLFLILSVLEKSSLLWSYLLSQQYVGALLLRLLVRRRSITTLESVRVVVPVALLDPDALVDPLPHCFLVVFIC